MKHALFYALRETLGEKKWTPSVQEAWTEVYEELSGEIIRVFCLYRALFTLGKNLPLP